MHANSNMVGPGVQDTQNDGQWTEKEEKDPSTRKAIGAGSRNKVSKCQITLTLVRWRLSRPDLNLKGKRKIEERRELSGKTEERV